MIDKIETGLSRSFVGIETYLLVPHPLLHLDQLDVPTGSTSREMDVEWGSNADGTAGERQGDMV